MTNNSYKGVPIFNSDGTFVHGDDKVEGRSYSSNLTKLVKHMDKLQALQQGKPPSPVMAHISLTNACNLTCSFCCFANRDISEKLETEKVLQALDSFKKIGVTGVEFTGGGEPSIHPDFKKIVRYAKDLGFSLGICTNGVRFGVDRPIKKDIVELFDWVRLGMYGFYEGYFIVVHRKFVNTAGFSGRTAQSIISTTPRTWCLVYIVLDHCREIGCTSTRCLGNFKSKAVIADIIKLYSRISLK